MNKKLVSFLLIMVLTGSIFVTTSYGAILFENNGKNSAYPDKWEGGDFNRGLAKLSTVNDLYYSDSYSIKFYQAFQWDNTKAHGRVGSPWQDYNQNMCTLKKYNVGYINEGLWIGVAFYIPADVITTGEQFTIMNHRWPKAPQGSIYIYITDNGRLGSSYVTNAVPNRQYSWFTITGSPVTKGTWHTLVIYMFPKSDSTGIIKVWYDKSSESSSHKIVNNYDWPDTTGAGRWAFGLYTTGYGDKECSPASADYRILYMDNFKIADKNGSFTEVYPGNLSATETPTPTISPLPTLLYSDNFNNLNNWTAEKEDASTIVNIVNGKMNLDSPKGLTVWFKTKLSGNIRIEYDVTVIDAGGANDRVSDNNCFWMAKENDGSDVVPGTRNGVFSSYNNLKLYYVGMGGHNNTKTRFRRYDGTGSAGKIILGEYTDSAHLITANRTYHIKIICMDGETEFYVDGELYFQLNDTNPYTEGYFGIRTLDNHEQIDNFKVYNLDENIITPTPTSTPTGLPPFVGPVSMRGFHSSVLHRTLVYPA